MDSTTIERLVERDIRPKVRNDGGDVTFVSLAQNTIRIAAHADCATCAATDQCLKWWIERELTSATGQAIRVVIEKRPPYFTRSAA